MGYIIRNLNCFLILYYHYELPCPLKIQTNTMKIIKQTFLYKNKYVCFFLFFLKKVNLNQWFKKHNFTKHFGNENIK